MGIKLDEDSLPQAIKQLFELNQFTVLEKSEIHGAEVDLIASPTAPFGVKVYIEATIDYVDNTKYGKDLTKLAMIKFKEPSSRCIIVSSSGFSSPVKERAAQTGIETFLYDELFSTFEKFDPYVRLVTGSGELAAGLQQLDQIYEEPDFHDKSGKESALKYLQKWKVSTDNTARWLIVVGEYGTGKTALTRILQYRWTREYQLNPSAPIPLRIELRDFVRQFDARGLLHHFLDKSCLGHLPIEFVISLLKRGRLILLLDGYDEMAQYLNSRERRACLEALAELSAGGVKGILTSRPNYFSEVEELQIFEVLYASVQRSGIYLTETDRATIAKEKEIDDLLTTQFIDRYERVLNDLTHEQTIALVERNLRHDEKGRKAVLDILNRVFRSLGENESKSLSGKPVIIGYLLEVVDQLADSSSETDKTPITEWGIYRLIVDQLMMRDFRRSPQLMPEKRLAFLHELSLWLSAKDHEAIKEVEFKDLVRKHFKNELRRSLPDEREQKVEMLFADLRSSATLTRNTEAPGVGWKFSHNSLREFLLTDYLFAKFAEGNIVNTTIPISDPMKLFAFSKDAENLRNHVEILVKLWPLRKSNPGFGQALSLMWDSAIKVFHQSDDPVRDFLVAISGEAISLDGISLKRINFSIDNRPAMLKNISIKGGEISEVNFSYCDLSGANFSDAIIESVNFTNSNLASSRFSGSIIDNINISGSVLNGADFTGVDSSMSIVVDDDNSKKVKSRLEGIDAIGYLRFKGAITSDIPKYFIYQHSPKFVVIQKICEVMFDHSIHQRIGLEQRGRAALDPALANKFVEHLIKCGIATTKGSRPGMIWTSPRGREVFGKFCNEKEICTEIEDFIVDNL